MIMAAYVLCNIKRSQSSHMRRYFVNGKANVMKVSLSFLLSRFKNISFVLLFKKFIYNAIIIMFRIIRTKNFNLVVNLDPDPYFYLCY